MLAQFPEWDLKVFSFKELNISSLNPSSNDFKSFKLYGDFFSGFKEEKEVDAIKELEAINKIYCDFKEVLSKEDSNKKLKSHKGYAHIQILMEQVGKFKTDLALKKDGATKQFIEKNELKQLQYLVKKYPDFKDKLKNL